MALDPTKWEIQNDRDIRYIGPAHTVAGANWVSGLEFHRWLQDRAAGLAIVGDDFMDLGSETPSEKLFDTIIVLQNGFNIDDATAQYIYAASVIQDDGNVIYDGIRVDAKAGAHIEIVQNGAIIADDFWNSIPNGSSLKGINPDAANGIAAQFMVKVRSAGADIDGRRLLFQTREWGKTFSERKINGTARGVNVVALTYGDDLNNTTLEATIAAIADISNTEGYRSIDVNNDGTPENYYSEWDRGANSINTFYERMKWLTRRGSASTIYGLNGELFRGITHEVAVTTPRTGTVSEAVAASWTGGTGQILARDSGAAATKLWIQLLTGVAPTAGQTITVGAATVTAAGGTPSTERELSQPFCGVSTGAAIIGAYGFGLQALDLSASDKVFDLTNTQRQAPNYVTFSVGGVVSGEDNIQVGPLGYRFSYDGEATGPFVVGETLTFTSPAGTAKVAAVRDLGSTGEIYIGPMLSGSVPSDNSTITGGTSGATAAVNGLVKPTFDLRHYTLNGALTGAAVTSVVVNEAIQSWVPSTGTLRILRANGAYTVHPYSAYNSGTKTFTITSHDFSTNNAANGAGAYPVPIYKLAGATSESFTGIYPGSDVSLYVRVRDGGASPIKTFETPATLGSGGGSTTAVRTSDA